MTTIRMAQYGTKHAHAAGKFKAMLQNPNVEIAGVFEPDAERRHEMEMADTPYKGAHWFETAEEMLNDPTIIAVVSEGRPHEGLDQTEACVNAGKHVWYDKPAGDDWPQWQRIIAKAEAQGTLIQMGYMFRYHAGFRQIGDWAKSGLLGDLFGIRIRIGTAIAPENRTRLARHKGGIFFELGCHVLDQIVWLLGRPHTVTSFMRNDASSHLPEFADNTLGVFEFDSAMAYVDTSAMETRPPARRIEVYGTRGSAIMEPLEPATEIRLCLAEAAGGFQAGEQMVPIEVQTRQQLYELELAAFRAAISGQQAPDRSLAHELLVQETLLRVTGAV
ncbi:MAG: Gfo/Idh/MocA family oxidoreductase [Chloroflexota bacterium]